MSLPEGMTAPTWERISRLPADKRELVLERAAILHYDGGVPFPEADELALAAEGYPTQRSIGGIE